MPLIKCYSYVAHTFIINRSSAEYQPQSDKLVDPSPFVLRGLSWNDVDVVKNTTTQMLLFRNKSTVKIFKALARAT